MKKTNTILIALVTLSAIFFAWALLGAGKQAPVAKNITVENTPAITSSLEVKTSDEGEVKIAVQPENIAENGSEWDFRIVMDTHFVELIDDLVKMSMLTGDSGAKYPPIGWEGDPPGGHHRGGILKFKAVAPLPSSITLAIKDVGSIAERKFIWQVKGR